jgi:hypothetical protein
MKRRLLTVATLTPVGVLGVSGLALALWTVASTGAAGSAAVDSLGAAATVSTSNVTATSVSINVDAKPATGPTPTSYRVDRTAPSAAPSVCTITGGTGSCVDSNPVLGVTNTYAVYSRLGTSWVSATSATASANVPSSDTTAPVTTATPSPAPNGAGWNNANVSVQLAATDGGSGVKQITYSASGAQTIAQTTVSGASTSVSITTEGTTTISYFATDNANNVETTKTVTVKLDKTAPGAPTGLTLTTATDSGSSNSDGITSNTAPTFTGSAEANSTISLFNGATQVGTGTTNGTGTFTVTISPALAQGSYSITAKATDAAGNTSAASTAKSLVIDTAASIISMGQITGSTSNGNGTINGTINEFATYTYVICAGAATSCTTPAASGSGSSAATTPFGWSIGYNLAKSTQYTVTVTATDKAGNVSTPTSKTWNTGTLPA